MDLARRTPRAVTHHHRWLGSHLRRVTPPRDLSNPSAPTKLRGIPTTPEKAWRVQIRCEWAIPRRPCGRSEFSLYLADGEVVVVERSAFGKPARKILSALRGKCVPVSEVLRRRDGALFSIATRIVSHCRGRCVSRGYRPGSGKEYTRSMSLR